MDYPYQYVPEDVAAQDRLPLEPAALKAFFQTTAEQVFGLAPAGHGEGRDMEAGLLLIGD